MRMHNIHQIESTSVCNLKCKYCIHPVMKRKKQHLDWHNFIRAMEWVLYLREQRGGEQREIALTGVGEPFLNPNMPDMIKYCREQCPETLITVSTNGTTITEELCDRIAPYNPRIFVSMHKPGVAATAVKVLKAHGLFEMTNEAFRSTSFNWAGQVDWPVGAHGMECEFLKTGECVVLSDGRIVRCCMDGEGLGVLGHVGNDPQNLAMAPFHLCEACHMHVPAKEATG